MKKYISKRAEYMDTIKSQIKKLWRQDAGILENVFNILSFMTPLIPGIGLSIFIIEKIASFGFNKGLVDFGRWLDQKCAFGPNSDFDPNKLQSVLTETLTSRANLNNPEEIRKYALFGSLLTRAIPAVVKTITKVIAMVISLWGVNSIREIYKEFQKDPMGLAEQALEQAQKLSLPTETELEEEII